MVDLQVRTCYTTSHQPPYPVPAMITPAILLSVLGLFVTIFGSLLFIVYTRTTASQNKIDSVTRDLNDHKLEVAERYITIRTMEKAIEAALQPIHISMGHVGAKLDELAHLLQDGNR